MLTVSVDFTKCSGCMTCEDNFPTFRNVHGGRYVMSRTADRDKKIRYMADRAKENCPNNAIRFDITPGA